MWSGDEWPRRASSGGRGGFWSGGTLNCIPICIPFSLFLLNCAPARRNTRVIMCHFIEYIFFREMTKMKKKTDSFLGEINADDRWQDSARKCCTKYNIFWAWRNFDNIIINIIVAVVARASDPARVTSLSLHYRHRNSILLPTKDI